MLKNIMYGVVALAILGVVLSDKGGSESGMNLDQALSVASSSLNTFESTTDVNEGNVMSKFSEQYSQNLNASQPALYNGTIGVAPAADGSFQAYDDVNNNQVKDDNETDLFKLEVDNENSRLLASDETSTRESGFSGSGLLMGMLIGNLMSRQRATGANPAAKKATPRSSSKSKGFSSAKSRAGSGSHSSGK